jgi:hypothetical protein
MSTHEKTKPEAPAEEPVIHAEAHAIKDNGLPGTAAAPMAIKEHGLPGGAAPRAIKDSGL